MAVVRRHHHGRRVAAIIGGILVFGEPIGSGPLAVGARVVAFGLVIVGAALIPSHHTDQREPEPRGPPIVTPLRQQKSA
jgi:hypothetical protein